MNSFIRTLWRKTHFGKRHEKKIRSLERCEKKTILVNDVKKKSFIRTLLKKLISVNAVKKKLFLSIIKFCYGS